MSEDIIHRKSTSYLQVTSVLLMLLIVIGSYWETSNNLTRIIMETPYFITLFVLVSISVMLLGLAIGRRMKRSLDYFRPTWTFTVKHFRLDVCKSLIREHNRRYRYLVQSPTFWQFMTPLLLVIAGLGLPLYFLNELPSFVWTIPFLVPFFLPLIFAASIHLGYTASANTASEDFTLPLIREAIYLAKVQSEVDDLSDTRVALDVAEHGEYRIYKNPRSLAWVKDLEDHAYIETWSKELGAVARMLVRINKTEDHDGAIWWWFNYDRFFFRVTSEDGSGYYVRFPVESAKRNLDVKDIVPLTRNAVALIQNEWARMHSKES